MWEQGDKPTPVGVGCYPMSTVPTAPTLAKVSRWMLPVGRREVTVGGTSARLGRVKSSCAYRMHICRVPPEQPSTQIHSALAYCENCLVGYMGCTNLDDLSDQCRLQMAEML